MPESGQSNREQRRRGGSPLRSRNGVPVPDVRGVASHADETASHAASREAASSLGEQCLDAIDKS
jgi:hypothetical protein